MTRGTQLAHYEILSAIGKGGMGEVWKARDTKLGREVAIKTLPPEFAQDADRLSRFEREAKLLASLNHPNIAAIYGLEEHEGSRFLVLELVEGDTLADRLKRGAIPVEESLKLALQIAEALEAAHEKGVIHRDLKPANIKVTPEGKVKVLDFGLAKAFAGEEADVNLSNSPTLSMQATQAGIILGTAAYMSPEQASGKDTDRRADVWSFGVVLFEMLTGRQVFDGETVSHVLAAVLAKDPNWDSLPHNLHPRLRQLLERCIAKSVKDRYTGIGDARVDIQKVLADPDGVLVQPVAEVVQAQPTSKLPWVAAIVLVAVISSVVVWNLKQLPIQAPTRFFVPLSVNAEFDAAIRAGLPVTAVSPDGRSLAYLSGNGLYLRDLGELDVHLLPDTEDAAMPLFSSDGQWLVFWADGVLRRISLSGGFPEDLLEDPDIRGTSWRNSDEIVYGTTGSGLWSASTDGADAIPVTTADIGTSHRWPDVLPGGEGAVLAIQTGSPETGVLGTSQIAVANLETGTHTELGIDGVLPRYVSTGHIIFARGSSLWAVPFDAQRLEMTGDPQPTGIEDIGAVRGTSQFAVSGGTLIYLSGLADVAADAHSLVWVDRNGVEEATLEFDPELFFAPRISPDGNRIAVQVGESVWTGDLQRGDLIPLTPSLTDDEDSETPLWTEDGAEVIYTGTRAGEILTLRQSATGGEEETLPIQHDRHHHLSDISADGQTLVWHYTFITTPETNGIWTSELVENANPTPFRPNDVGGQSGVLSPDQQWLAYVSYESEEPRVYAAAYPDGDRRQLIGPGTEPMWSRDGSEIFYRSGTQMMAAVVDTTNSLAVESIVSLFEDSYVHMAEGAGGHNYDVTDDGRLFLMVNVVDVGIEDVSALEPQINVVLNWFQELRERVPVD